MAECRANHLDCIYLFTACTRNKTETSSLKLECWHRIKLYRHSRKTLYSPVNAYNPPHFLFRFKCALLSNYEGAYTIYPSDVSRCDDKVNRQHLPCLHDKPEIPTKNPLTLTERSFI